MKHKVQEVFDNREEYRRWQDDVQDLINCQLTVEEIEVLINSVNSTLVMIHQSKIENGEIAIQFWGKVLNKFQKQKEMWVEE